MMLAKLIEKLRKEHKLSQSFLAEKLAISRPTYAQIEEGRREPSILEARKIAELFNLSFEDFLRGAEADITVNIQKAKPNAPAQKTSLRISVPQESAEKFKQILCYILRKVGGKPNVGMTVLYKLLYFIDFDYYEKYEEQLMGLLYIKNHFGPTPPLFKKITDDMIQQGELEMIKSKFYQHPQTKYLINPTVEPNLSILNGQEKEHIDEELMRLSDLTASQLSDLSHRDVPWITAKEGKPIDYESVFYRTHETSVRIYHDED